MSKEWNELGKKLYIAAGIQSIDTVKKIISKSHRNAQVIDWKNEKVHSYRSFETQITLHFEVVYSL